MRGRKTSFVLASVFGFLVAGLLAGVSQAYAQTYSVVYSFGQNIDYWGPYFPPVVGPGGVLYGTLAFGGSSGDVYELTPSAQGWNESAIAGLPSSPQNGAQLIVDSAGNLYGVTPNGGEYGAGTVFELSPGPAGWTETTLHSFNYLGKDGNTPEGGLILDSAGNIYGTTVYGGGSGASCGNGENGCGTVFKLSPTEGAWSETILHSFLDQDEDGELPLGALVMDAAGNLYGTTSEGGYSWGVAFELTPAGGTWKEKILHRFSYSNIGKDGIEPSAGLALDAIGNLFGTTSYGGVFSKGTAFELSPTENGGWVEKVIHNFGSGFNGSPSIFGDALLVDSADNLYGTTTDGGSAHKGTVFEISPASNGSWTEKTLHTFLGNKAGDGSTPNTGLVFGAAGVLYGVTYYGGAYNAGTIYQVIP